MGLKIKKNLELADAVVELLESERDAGVSMTKTLQAAVYWFFKRLDSGQRDRARIESQRWIKTGVAVEATEASERDLAADQKLSATLEPRRLAKKAKRPQPKRAGSR